MYFDLYLKKITNVLAFDEKNCVIRLIFHQSIHIAKKSDLLGPQIFISYAIILALLSE